MQIQEEKHDHVHDVVVPGENCAGTHMDAHTGLKFNLSHMRTLPLQYMLPLKNKAKQNKKQTNKNKTKQKNKNNKCSKRKTPGFTVQLHLVYRYLTQTGHTPFVYCKKFGICKFDPSKRKIRSCRQRKNIQKKNSLEFAIHLVPGTQLESSRDPSACRLGRGQVI